MRAFSPFRLSRGINIPKATLNRLSLREVSYKIGFMFPGQGSQSVGMAKTLCEEIPAAKSLFDQASGILGYDLLSKCVRGPLTELNSTAVAQPAIFVSSMAALEKLKIQDAESLTKCSVAMGLSLGEYSALCFAGAISFEDGVKLTKVRGDAMQAAADSFKSGMVGLIGADLSCVAAICKAAHEQSGEAITIGNYLMDGNYSVSGGLQACNIVKELAPKMGVRMTVPLAVAGAFHTTYMQSAVPRLVTALNDINIKQPRIPVISNVDAKPHGDVESIRQKLANQVIFPVQWETIMKTMLSSPEFEECYEIGPGTVCKGIILRYKKRTRVISVQA